VSSIKSFHDCKTHEEFENFRWLADHQARCFVNPVRKHGGSGKWEPVGYEFAERFLVHPWVREAISEGWDKELRGVLINEVKHRIMHGQSYDSIDELMPPKKWVEDAKAFAARCAAAADWQKKHMPNGIFGKLKLVPKGDEE
jgi:hypothetical protein